MTKRIAKWLVCVLVLIVFAGVIKVKFFTQTEEAEEVFTYEFVPDNSTTGKTMAILQLENLEYEIEEPEDPIVSEPSPDWGIRVYYTEDKSNYLYFYASRSPHGIDPFPNEETERNTASIKGGDVIWGNYGTYVVGSYAIDDGFGIIFQIEESLWNEKEGEILSLIESARVY